MPLKQLPCLIPRVINQGRFEKGPFAFNDCRRLHSQNPGGLAGWHHIGEYLSAACLTSIMKNTTDTDTWETMIDGTSFGVIAGYLRRSNSGIDQILHVRNRAMLAEVAALIAPSSPPNAAEQKKIHETINRMVTDGLVKFSCRGIDELPGRRDHINPNRINPSAFCEVIYAPPFYLAHTPGLFEGRELMNTPSGLVGDNANRKNSHEGNKQQSKSRNHGHSH